MIDDATSLMYKQNNRDTTVDLIKAIGIFCMVAGHCGAPFTKFIYLFHMAIFFIASGYCYKSTNSDNFSSLKKFVIRKLKTLWLPYILWTAIYSFSHNLFIMTNVYTNNPLLFQYISGKNITTTDYWTLNDMLKNILKAFIFHGRTQMGGAFWFIITLMVLSIVYCIIDFAIKSITKGKLNLLIQGVVSVVFLSIGYMFSLSGHSFAGLERVFSYYFLFFIGYVFKKHGISSMQRKAYIRAITFVGCLAILLILNNFGSISLDSNSYVNPIYFLVASCAGWQLLYETSLFLCKINVIKKLLACIGRNTMAVVILHFLCFKIVSYIGVIYNGLPLCLVAAFPILFKGGVWWIAYLIIGLTLPFVLSLGWKRLKSLCKTKLNRAVAK